MSYPMINLDTGDRIVSAVNFEGEIIVITERGVVYKMRRATYGQWLVYRL